MAVRVTGKVTKRHQTRRITVLSVGECRMTHVYDALHILLGKCKSYNEEPQHWQQVRALHKSSYSVPGPFILPTPLSVAPPSDFYASTTQQEPPSPSTSATSYAPSVASSPPKPETTRSVCHHHHQPCMIRITNQIVAAKAPTSISFTHSRPHRQYFSNISETLHRPHPQRRSAHPQFS